MSYCRQCGRKIEDYEFKCPNCGNLTKEIEFDNHCKIVNIDKPLNYVGIKERVAISGGRGVSFILPDGEPNNLRLADKHKIDIYNLGHLFVIFDGSVGKIRADLDCLKAAKEFWTEYYLRSETKDLQVRIQEIVSKINENLYNSSKGRVSYGDIGVSLAGVVMKNDQAFCFNVGNSRCYLLTEDKIEQLTKDDFEVDRRTEEDISRNKKVHPNTKALGFSQTIDLHIYPSFTLSDQSKILISSTGIHTNLTNEQLQKIVFTGNNLKDISNRLLHETIEVGKDKDLSYIIIEHNLIEENKTIDEYCLGCGNKLDSDDLFCDNCGMPINLNNKTPSYLVENKLKYSKYLGSSRFLKLGIIGKGPNGIVVKTKDFKQDGIIKALKVLNINGLKDKSFMFKLESEAVTMSKIDHEHVARFWDIHFQDDMTFLEQEYVAGESIAKIIEQNTDHKISERRIWQLASQISAGMQAIHKAGLLHLNLKPENILLTKLCEVKVTDYALVAEFKNIIHTNKDLLIYASPEQLAEEEVGKESDVWSFGAMLFHILTGKVFASRSTNDELLKCISEQEFEPSPELSDSMNALLAKCLNNSPEARFSNFTEVSEFIDNALKLLQKLEISEDVFFNSVLVEGGSFQMGSESGKDNEKPVHKVTVSDFYMGKYQVTQAEWMEIMGENHSLYKKENNPVEKVNWYDAVEYCNKKSIKDGLDPVYSSSGKEIKCDFSKVGYRLPTEAEWEYAAKGGKLSKGYKYSGSDKCYEVALTWDYHVDFPNPVGINAPNELGIYDMSGNVCEWCWDYFNKYSAEEETNPLGPIIGDERVIRGGSWGESESSCSVSSREFRKPDKRNCEIGLRIVRSVI